MDGRQRLEMNSSADILSGGNRKQLLLEATDCIRRDRLRNKFDERPLSADCHLQLPISLVGLATDASAALTW